MERESNNNTNKPLTVVLAWPSREHRPVIQHPSGNALLGRPQMGQRLSIARHMHATGEFDRIDCVLASLTRHQPSHSVSAGFPISIPYLFLSHHPSPNISPFNIPRLVISLSLYHSDPGGKTSDFNISEPASNVVAPAIEQGLIGSIFLVRVPKTAIREHTVIAARHPSKMRVEISLCTRRTRVGSEMVPLYGIEAVGAVRASTLRY